MSIQEILEFVVLPILGWSLYAHYDNRGRLSRIEFCLKLLMKKAGFDSEKNNKNNDE